MSPTETTTRGATSPSTSSSPPPEKKPTAPPPAPKKRTEAENALEGHAEHIKTEQVVPLEKMRKDGRLAGVIGVCLALGLTALTCHLHRGPDGALDFMAAYHVKPWQLRVFSILGAIFFFAILAPVPFYKVWMPYVAGPMGWLSTRVILSLAFFIGFTPYSFFMWVTGKDLLHLKRRQGSYWIARHSRDPQHFKHPF
jgi:hypothetical protein